MSKTLRLLDGEEVDRTLERLAFEVLERHGGVRDLALVGIQRRGVQIAQRIKRILDQRGNGDIPLGKLDINLYRDDWTSLQSQPHINSTEVGFSIDDREILLVDDVLYTGRTIRAALEAILDFGRPRVVELLVLIDRGNRELPIHADFVGKKVNTARDEQVDVLVAELDSRDEVVLQGRS
jgi:pyrimidine operon attenuation protein/uracil phosphoribosyltransferase